MDDAVPAGRKKKIEGQSAEPQPKRSKNDEYSSISQRMMSSMGYVPGQGIGKHGTGILNPIDESTHKGRRGLGYYLDGLEKEDVQWELEEVHFNQVPEWMAPCQKQRLTLSDFTGWMSIGERKTTINDEVSFCDPIILQKILDAKSVFDKLSEKEFRDARMRSNPFESIQGVIFQNRAAMKMSNIDAVFEFMFTNPKHENNEDLGPHDLLYFADICSGPGGFSEYVLWKKKWHAKGFGMTLKDPESGSDFRLDNFLAAPCESFDPHYGVGAYRGDGDITKPENLDAFKKYVLECTNEIGVHFVMADGGISVEGQENIQEILTKQLVLCQYICALSVLRKGGNFVCKVFDMFTPFSIGLFYLLYRSFRRVCLFKPVTSRPANSERYVICEDFLQGGNDVGEYMYAINLQLIQLKENQSNLDVLNVVPQGILDRETHFLDYVKAFNDSFGINQATNLRKLQYYVKNILLTSMPIELLRILMFICNVTMSLYQSFEMLRKFQGDLQDHRQSEIKRKCLALWKVPNDTRKILPDLTAYQVFMSAWEKLKSNIEFGLLKTSNFSLVDTASLDFLKDVHSWKWCWASGKRFFVVGLGRDNVQTWDITSNKPSFSTKQDLHGLELPRGTVLEVEILQELIGEGSGQRRQTAAYILDVVCIHEEMYDTKPINERLRYAKKLCQAMNKPCRKGSVLLKVKEYYRVADFQKQFSKLKLKECKGQSSSIPTYPVSEEYFIAPVGVVFVKVTKDPWHIHLSKREKQFYYYDSHSQKSTYHCPASSISTYTNTLLSRHLWLWNRTMFNDLCSEEENLTEETLNRSMFAKYINKLL